MEINVHATAVVIGTRGILFVGPSGTGKSALAFTCLALARREGAYAALVADDRVLLSRAGAALVARCPPSISGLMELRGSGIVSVESVTAAVLDVAVQVVSLGEAERLPPENEQYVVDPVGCLPLVRIWNKASDPLAHLAALCPELQGQRPFC